MSLPVVGAALLVEELADHRAWLLERPRDLEIQSFCDAEVLEGDWRPMVAEAKRLLDGFAGRLGIHGPFWGLSIATPDPDVRAVVTKRMLQGLDVCAALGADQMVIHSPYTTWDWHNLDMRPRARTRVIEAARACLAPVLARAADQGVQLVLENIEDIDPLDRARLAEALDWHALAISVDTGHAMYAHGSTGAPPPDYFVRVAGARLAHIHLQDADGHADRHWRLGRGRVAWPAVFQAIADTGANPRLILEMNDVADVLPSARWLEAQGLAE
ncbi:MAG: sugar phosphate isomerase/epimerase [Rhodobacteraceae bacterium]|jgi:sugar phosphate isomerase/epimerase|nr:sugar phosphate isomerase/epimerase [Paracoccaceae bacterium]